MCSKGLPQAFIRLIALDDVGILKGIVGAYLKSCDKTRSLIMCMSCIWIELHERDEDMLNAEIILPNLLLSRYSPEMVH